MAGIIFKAEWMPLIATLPDAEAGQLLKAIASHVQGEEPGELPAIMQGIYLMMTASIDADLSSYEARCERSRASAQARWEKKRAEQEQETPETEAEESEKPKKQRKKKAAEPAPDPDPIPEVASMVNFWNENVQPWAGKGAVCRPGTQKEKKLQETIRAYSEAAIKKAFLKLKGSWLVKQEFFTFDWIMTPENLEKVLQGNYNKAEKPAPAKRERMRRITAQLS